MKNLLLILLSALLVTACNSNKKEEETTRHIQLLTDSTVYTNNNIYTDTIATVANTPQKSEQPHAVAVPRAPKKNVAVPQPARTNYPVYTEPRREEAKVPQVATPPVIAESPAPTNSGSTSGSSTAPTPVPQKKTGWNKATQGAVIGGAVGAVGGAIISKKKGLGAVVGGIAGAAGGYVIGKNKDKKENK